jgi:hypothetical protein
MSAAQAAVVLYQPKQIFGNKRKGTLSKRKEAAA